MMMMVMTMMKLLTDYTGCFSQFRSLSQLVRMGGPLLPKLKPHLCGKFLKILGHQVTFFGNVKVVSVASSEADQMTPRPCGHQESARGVSE